MVEKIYKKVIYSLARVAVKYIEYKKKDNRINRLTTLIRQNPSRILNIIRKQLLIIFR